MKMYGKLEVKFYAFFTTAINGDEWSISHRDIFDCRERSLGTHKTG
jgi:hypothetical protein